MGVPARVSWVSTARARNSALPWASVAGSVKGEVSPALGTTEEWPGNPSSA